MSSRNRERRIANREARLAAAEAAQRRARRLRWGVPIGALLLAAVIAIGFLVANLDDDDDGTVEASSGKECIAPVDPLPGGSPEVAVQVGPAPTSLIVEDVVAGNGEEVLPAATIKAHYTGYTCTTGTLFDSSYSRGEPSEFSLARVIKGWTDGIPGMKVGGRRLLGIPADQAYGADGRPPDIGPDEPLWFVVEVTEITQQGTATTTAAPTTSIAPPTT